MNPEKEPLSASPTTDAYSAMQESRNDYFAMSRTPMLLLLRLGWISRDAWTVYTVLNGLALRRGYITRFNETMGIECGHMSAPHLRKCFDELEAFGVLKLEHTPNNNAMRRIHFKTDSGLGDRLEGYLTLEWYDRLSAPDWFKHKGKLLEFAQSDFSSLLEGASSRNNLSGKGVSKGGSETLLPRGVGNAVTEGSETLLPSYSNPKNNNKDNTRLKGGSDGVVDLLGVQNSMDEDEKAAREIADTLRHILAKARKLSPSSKTGRGWYLEVLKVTKNPELGITLQDMKAPLSDLQAYWASDTEFKIEFEAMSGYIEKFRRLVKSIDRWKNPPASKTAPQIDETLKAKVVSAYRAFCDEYGAAEWARNREEAAINMLCASAVAHRAFRKAAIEEYNRLHAIKSEPKPPVGGTGWTEWAEARDFCNAMDAVNIVDCDARGFIHWWCNAVRIKFKTWKPDNLAAFNFKPDSALFRDHALKFHATDANSLATFLSHMASIK